MGSPVWGLPMGLGHSLLSSPLFCLWAKTLVRGLCSARRNAGKPCLVKSTRVHITFANAHRVSLKFHVNCHVLLKQLWGYLLKEVGQPLPPPSVPLLASTPFKTTTAINGRQGRTQCRGRSWNITTGHFSTHCTFPVMIGWEGLMCKTQRLEAASALHRVCLVAIFRMLHSTVFQSCSLPMLIWCKIKWRIRKW